ncbi:MAG: hypothetical protein Q4A37_03275 [Candidatus Saccharibacteria bacterium]|nr:hypothetical protein [Candidatus Saccharibacteria bacterium]
MIAVERGSENVAVLDMRASEVLDVEYKMAGYETAEKRRRLLPLIDDKLQLIARAVAGGDAMLSKLKHLDDRDSEKYPLPISYWGNIGRNPSRVYVSLLDVAKMLECEMKQELLAQQVDKLVLFIGACDKNHQPELMSKLKRFSW